MRGLIRAVVKGACRLYPLYSGMSRLPNGRMLLALHGGQSKAWARLRDGSWLCVYLRDFIGTTIYYMGEYDPKITWLLRQFLRTGDTFLDIGANYGLYTMIAARLVGERGVVHAFEPQPDLAEMIRESARRNGFRNVVLHEIAMSDEEGRMRLHVPDGNCGAASLAGESWRKGREIEVEVRRTGAYLEGLGLRAIRVAKIDVEGHEAAVLRGGEEFLRRCPPTAMVFESRDREGRFWERPAVRAIQSLGYELYRIPKALLVMRLEKLRAGVDQEVRGHDFGGLRAGEARGIGQGEVMGRNLEKSACG